MTDKPKNRKKSLIILSIVKALLVVISFSFLYDVDFDIKFDTWYFTSGVANSNITIICSDEEVTCKLICKNGWFYSNGFVKEIEMPVNQRISWKSHSFEKTFDDHIEVLLMKDGQVVGKAIIHISKENDDSWYIPTVIAKRNSGTTALEYGICQLISKFS